MKKYLLLLALTLLIFSCSEKIKSQPVKVLVLTERGGQHEGFVSAALNWLEDFGQKNDFTFTELNHASEINEQMLSNYQVFIQLDYPPYTWSQEAEQAFIKFIGEGKIGWVGFHHATLLGEFDGYPLWQWFSDFMGGIRFQNYIAELADGTVQVEDAEHPVMRGVAPNFIVTNDEWYTFDKSPRANVHVLANVNEASYNPPSEIKMGDHPAIWTNPNMKARNVYFLMGHHKDLLKNDNFTRMFSNAIFWTSGRKD